MRIEHELLGCALVEVLVALRGILQRNDCGVDRLGNLYLVIEDRHHQLAMVAHNWALSRGEGVGLGPTQTYTDTQLTNLGILVFAPWVASHIETRNTQTSSGTCDSHDIVQHCRWLLMRASTVTTCLKANTVYCCIYFRFTDDLGDHIR